MDGCYEETEEDASLYVVDAAIEYKADYGLERRPFSPPFKILWSSGYYILITLLIILKFHY